MLATIKEVAKLAGVSTSTVSNVLNNNLNIKKDKYDRVIAAMNELNYRPNILARNLKNRQAYFIAVVLPSYEGKYASILRGIHNIIDGKKYQLITRITDNDIRVERTALEELLGIGVSGIMIEPCDYLEEDYYNQIIMQGIPVIFLERDIERYGVSSVVCDDYLLMVTEVGKKLKSFSFKELYLVRGNKRISSEKKFEEGFYEICSAKKDFREEKFDSHIIECSFNRERALYTLWDHVSQLQDLPGAFVVTSQEVARALQKTLELMRFRAEIYTFISDDHGVEAEGAGNIHYIMRPTVELGRRAAQMMQSWLNNKTVYESERCVIKTVPEPKKYQMPVEIVKGKTIQMLLLDSPTADAIEKIKVTYEKDYCCNVNLKVRKYNEVRQEIQNQLDGKQPMDDIWMVDLPWFPKFVEQECLYDMSSLLKEDRRALEDYPSRILNTLAYKNGRLWGWPIMAAVQLLYYRKDLFENSEIKYSFLREYGFELKVPVTWKEFNIIAEFFTRSINKKSPVIYGTAISDMQDTSLVDEFLARGGMTETMYYNSRDDKVWMDRDKAVYALKNLKECSVYSYRGQEDYWWDIGFEQLLAGNLAMLTAFSSIFPVYSKATHLGAHYNSIGVTTVPGKKPVLGGWSLCISRGCKIPEEAFSWIRWLTAAERSKLFVLLGGFIPSITVLNNAGLNINIPWLKSNLEGFENGKIRKSIRKADGELTDQYENDIVFAKHIRDVINDKCTPNEALRRIENETEMIQFV